MASVTVARRLLFALIFCLVFKKYCFSQRVDRGGRCRSEQSYYDQCGRHCVCVTNRRLVCCRIRREFSDMFRSEKRRYINAVKTASTQQPYKERYERLITLHSRIFFTNIHQRDFFLPWHRWFISQYENLLREIDCRVTVPYWDWSLVAARPFSSNLWSSGSHGFGGNASGNASCVQNGPFRQGEWSVVASAGGGCLRRNFNGRAPDALAVRNLKLSNSRASRFENFELLLRTQFHNTIHCLIGGVMCSQHSAAAPEFFLHHGFVDKIWWDWQQQSNSHMFHSHFTRQTGRMPSTRYRSRDFLDLNHQADGSICVDYQEPRSTTFRDIQELSRRQIRRIPRLSLAPLSRDAERLFRTTSIERRRAFRLRRGIRPTMTLNRRSLRGTDAIQGFRTRDIEREIADKQPSIPEGHHEEGEDDHEGDDFFK